MSDFHEGQRVVYRAYRGARLEHGTVVRSNERHVFVRYDDDLSGTARATHPGNLKPSGEQS